MSKSKISLIVNGEKVELEVEPRKLMVNALRDDLGLTGTHVGCDTTNCGACTVIVDGKAVKSCTMFAVQASGREIKTIEGISKNGEMHPIQKAFIEKHGLQCGFCTPGMIMTSYWLLSNNSKPKEEDVRKCISGNICRCTGYQGIIDSVEYASEMMEKEKV
jgi:aerobic carbon-monoxide dehydrogenase small subunit